MEDMEKAKDKIMMGAERRSMVMSDDEKRLTAYHESGHAIVGRLVPEHDPVHKVSIIPRGRALGVTLFLPEDDRYYSKQRLESSISSLFGGRIAEELIFGAESVTTGAQNDIHRATEIARNMVTKWGLSDRLGPLTYSEEEQEVFLGHSVTQHKSVSDETTHLIDEEIRNIIERNYERARQLLTDNMDKLHAMAAALMKYETIDADQIDDIMSGRTPRPPKDWSEDEPTRARAWQPRGRGRGGDGGGRRSPGPPRRRALTGSDRESCRSASLMTPPCSSTAAAARWTSAGPG
jgi:cell division protease FtsH